MKLLLCSPDIFNSDIINKDRYEKIFNEFINTNICKVYFISSYDNKKEFIPDSLKSKFLKIESKRQSLIKKILESNHSINVNEVFVLGITENDFLMSTQANVILLSPLWIEINDKVIKYGISLNTIDDLEYFFKKTISITNPWFYNVEISETTKLYSLMSANSRYENDIEFKEVQEKFENLLKSQDKSYFNIVKYYFIYSLNLLPDIRNIKYWGYYPSSSSCTNNDILFEFKEICRKTFCNSRYNGNILIRHKSTSKRQFMSKNNRLILKCDGELSTINVDPYLSGKIRGETICILDDFTTNGSSCETVRNLFEREGVSKILFITFGKFGFSNDYNIFNYRIEGNIYREGYTYTFISKKQISGIKCDSNIEKKTALEGMIE